MNISIISTGLNISLLSRPVDRHDVIVSAYKVR